MALLTLITLGLYYVYWWYQVNRELRDLGITLDDDGNVLGKNPGLSALAVFPGFLLIVPPYLTLYNGVRRIQAAQRIVAGSHTLNGWIVLTLIVTAMIVGVTGLIVPAYIQSKLNKLWEAERAETGVPAEAVATA